jgi:hypothetical protein
MMWCALVVVSGLALFFAGVVAGVVLLPLLEQDGDENPTPPPPVCDDP